MKEPISQVEYVQGSFYPQYCSLQYVYNHIGKNFEYDQAYGLLCIFVYTAFVILTLYMYDEYDKLRYEYIRGLL